MDLALVTVSSPEEFMKALSENPTIRLDNIRFENEETYADLVSFCKKKDDPASLCVLGYCLEQGKGVDKDVDQARALYARAGNKGYGLGMHRLGLMYHEGTGVPPSDSKAFDFYMKAYQLGDKSAPQGIGVFYQLGWAGEKSLDKAIDYYNIGVRCGDPYAEHALGELFERKKDYAKAKAYYESASAKGLPQAKFRLGCLYDDGLIEPQSYEKAAELYADAAEYGLPFAQYNLALLYENGLGVKQSFPKAADLYKKAAEHKFIPAVINLAYCYLDGYGVEKKDPVEAARLFEIAAEKDTGAMVTLANLYSEGNGVTKSYAKAADYYQKAVDKGDYFAMCYLSAFYAAGQGVEVSMDKAKALLVKASESDEPILLLYIASRLDGDDYFEEDFDMAISIYKRIVQSKDADEMTLGSAYYGLACLYQQDTLDRDPELFMARECFAKALEHGYPCVSEIEALDLGMGLAFDESNKLYEWTKISSSDSATAQRSYTFIENRLKDEFGSAWGLLQEESRRLLLTGFYTYAMFFGTGKDVYETMDFSSCTLPIAKACEIEFGRIFFDGFLAYLKERGIPATAFDPASNTFVMVNAAKGSRLEKSFEDEKYIYFRRARVVGEPSVTYVPEEKKSAYSLGSFKYYANIRYAAPGKGGGAQNYRLSVNPYMLDYAETVFSEEAFPGPNRREKITEYLYYFATRTHAFADNVRNPSAHTNMVSYWKANYCANFVVLQDGFLIDFLRKIKR